MEAVNKFFIEDGHLDSTKNFNDEKNSEDKIIYEVVRIINGEPLFLNSHLKRMEKSFELMGKGFSYEHKKIEEYLQRVICSNDRKDGNLKITFNINEDVMKVFYIKHSYPTEEMYKNGVGVILYHGERNNPNAKVIDMEFRSKVKNEIESKNVFEAILVDKNENITEGSKSNIFVIKGKKIISSKVEDVLPGVTRSEIIKICENEKIEFEECNIKYTELGEVDAMFISGTSPGILPISKVENIVMDVNNEIMRKLMKLYNDSVKLDKS